MSQNIVSESAAARRLVRGGIKRAVPLQVYRSCGVSFLRQCRAADSGLAAWLVPVVHRRRGAAPHAEVDLELARIITYD